MGIGTRRNHVRQQYGQPVQRTGHGEPGPERTVAVHRPSPVKPGRAAPRSSARAPARACLT